MLQIVNTVVLYVSVLALMFFLNWQLALLSLLTLPFLLPSRRPVRHPRAALFSRMQRQWAQLTAVLQENVTGVRVVKAFAREDFEIGKFERENQVYLERNIAATRLQALVYPLMLFITSIGTIAIIWFGGQQVVAGTLTLGTLLAFSAYLARLAQPTRMLGFIIAWISRATPRRAPVRDPRRQVARRVPPRGAPAARHRGEGHLRPRLFRLQPAVRRARWRAGRPTRWARAAGRHPGGGAGPGGGPARPHRRRARPAWWPSSPASTTSPPGRAHRRAGRARGRSAEPAPADRDRDAESLLFSASVAENIAYGDPGASTERIVRRSGGAGVRVHLRAAGGFETKIGERG